MMPIRPDPRNTAITCSKLLIVWQTLDPHTDQHCDQTLGPDLATVRTVLHFFLSTKDPKLLFFGGWGGVDVWEPKIWVWEPKISHLPFKLLNVNLVTRGRGTKA
jgi:hypothetical protein